MNFLNKLFTQNRKIVNGKDYGRHYCVDQDFYNNPVGKKPKKEKKR